MQNPESSKNSIEVERKYKVLLKDGELPIESKKYELFQIYLETDEFQEERIRKTISKDKVIYTQTIKKPISATERFETEHEISKEFYASLGLRKARNFNVIHKTRSVFDYQNQLFELDDYHFPKLEFLILEIEKIQHHEDIVFPNFITIIEDVTGKKEYSNFELARIKNV